MLILINKRDFSFIGYEFYDFMKNIFKVLLCVFCNIRKDYKVIIIAYVLMC